MRPKQWAKNSFVFAGIFFDGRLFDLPRLLQSAIAFVIFCLLSSAIYLINDLADIERDRVHPIKRLRPLASGDLAPSTAVLAAIVIIAVCIPLSFVLSPVFGAIALAYTLLMVAYSFRLKNVVIVDVMTVAAGFVLRVFAGAVVAQVTRFSPWLYVCTTLLAVFISVNKRRNELFVLADNADSHRASLLDYSPAFLDKISSMVMATALASYSFYTFSAPNLPDSHLMMITIPFVMYGIFRYLYLVDEKNLGGAPEEIVLGDGALLLTILLWAVTAALVLYIPTL